MNRNLISVLAVLGLLGLNVSSAYAQIGFFTPGTPIPEPGILSLLAIGGVALGWSRCADVEKRNSERPFKSARVRCKM